MLKEVPQSHWNLPPEELVPNLYKKPESEPVWRPNPVDFAVGREPRNTLQERIFEELKTRLTNENLTGRYLPLPDRKNPPPQHLYPGTIFVFADGYLDSLISPREVYLKLPEPKPLLLLINTVDELPPIDFDTARRQLVAGSCQNGVVSEGDQNAEHIRKALWISMQGNHKIIKGSEKEIYDRLLLRTLAHYGSTFVDKRSDIEHSTLSWSEWEASSIHRLMATAARELGHAGIIQDKVELEATGVPHAPAILEALNKTSIGESMRSAFDPQINLMAVTVSGGGKINVSPNPKDGHLVPISHLHRKGYTVARPDGAQIDYPNGSVETHETGLIYLAGALARAGIVRNFQEFTNWLDDQFSKKQMIPIIPEGLRPMFLSTDHFHMHPIKETVDSNKIEIVHPDPRYYPKLDFPCGSFEAAMASLSAIWQSEAFQNPGPDFDPLRGKVIVAVLPGHGSIAIGKERASLTASILQMPLKTPEWV